MISVLVFTITNLPLIYMYRGKHWYTGVENVFATECPEGFWRGRSQTPKN